MYDGAPTMCPIVTSCVSASAYCTCARWLMRTQWIRAFCLSLVYRTYFSTTSFKAPYWHWFVLPGSRTSVAVSPLSVGRRSASLGLYWSSCCAQRSYSSIMPWHGPARSTSYGDGNYVQLLWYFLSTATSRYYPRFSCFLINSTGPAKQTK